MLSNKAIIISQPWQKCALVLQIESWVYTRIYTCHFFICLAHWPSRDKCAKHLQEAIQIAKQASIQSRDLEMLNMRLESLANGWKTLKWIKKLGYSLGGPYTEACCLRHNSNISRVPACLGFCCCLDFVFKLCLPHVSFIIRTHLMDIHSDIHSNLSDTPWQQNGKIAALVSSLTFLSWMTQGKEHVSSTDTYPGLGISFLTLK